MLFDIITGKGLSNNVLKSGDRLAAERQTPLEHEELLDERNLPGYREAMMLEGPARLMAIQQLRAQAALREAEYPKYWDDEVPRRPISQSSSWVGDIDYDPYSNVMQVQLGNKIYTYSKTPDQVAQIVNSPSIGGIFNGR
jgi:hypothetical protein